MHVLLLKTDLAALYQLGCCKRLLVQGRLDRFMISAKYCCILQSQGEVTMVRLYIVLETLSNSIF